MRVVPRIDEADTEGTETTMLRIALLEIAESLDECFAGNVLIVGVQVVLSGAAGIVYQNVGVGSHACYGTNHVAEREGNVSNLSIFTMPHHIMG